MPNRCRIALVEDQPAYREALTAHLGEPAGWRVVAACADAPEALRQIPASSPDLILIDIGLPGGISGIELLASLRPRVPGATCVIVTVVDDAARIVEALRMGAAGYLLKGSSHTETIEGIRRILAGEFVMSPAVGRRVSAWFQSLAPEPSLDTYRLSPQQTQILNLFARGWAEKEVAAHLGISVSTVSTHVGQIYRRMGVHSRGEALLKAFGRPPASAT